MDFQLDISNPGTSWRSRSKGSAFCETRSRQKRTQTSTIVSRPRRRVLFLLRVEKNSAFGILVFLFPEVIVILPCALIKPIRVRFKKQNINLSYWRSALLAQNGRH